MVGPRGQEQQQGQREGEEVAGTEGLSLPWQRYRFNFRQAVRPPCTYSAWYKAAAVLAGTQSSPEPAPPSERGQPPDTAMTR